MNKRERTIAMTAGAGLALFLVWQFAVSPLLDYRDSLARQIRAAEDLRDKNDTLLQRRKVVDKAWASLVAAGLQTDNPSAAGQLVVQLLPEWFSFHGLNGLSLKPENTLGSDKKDRFQKISFHATATGPQWRGGQIGLIPLLWQLESTSTPIRVNSLQVTPRKEATDDLTVTMTLSTIWLNTDAEKSKKPLFVSSTGEKP